MDTVNNSFRVALFINHDIGLNVFKYLLLDDKTKIVHVYIVTKNGEVSSEILRLCDLHSIKLLKDAILILLYVFIGRGY